MKWEICEQLVFDYLKHKKGHTKNAKTDGCGFWLFNNKIAEFKLGNLFICDGKYKHTASTARYLNAMGANITLKKKQFYKDGIKWDGSWISINEDPITMEQEEKTSLFN